MSAVDRLAATLRERILDGDLAPGSRLVEQELVREHGAARHTVRAALRALAATGLVAIEPNRGARVVELGPEQVRGLYELRTALEVEAVRLALEHGPLPDTVHAAVERLTRACTRRRARWSAVVEAHDDLHRALVAASGSPRIVAAHAALDAELRLFLVQLRPDWTPERMAADHAALPAALEARGPDALREHLRESAAAVLARLERSPGPR